MKLQVKWMIEGLNLIVQIVQQEPDSDGFWEDFASGGFKIESVECPQIIPGILFVRGTDETSKSRPYAFKSYKDMMEYIESAERAIKALNERRSDEEILLNDEAWHFGNLSKHDQEVFKKLGRMNCQYFVNDKGWRDVHTDGSAFYTGVAYRERAKSEEEILQNDGRKMFSELTEHEKGVFKTHGRNNCQYARGVGWENIINDGCSFSYGFIYRKKPAATEMTVAEVEAKLGHSVKIVK
jgi:hypothetical protein